MDARQPHRGRFSDDVSAAVRVLLASRAAVFLAGYLAVLVFGYPGGRPPVRDFDSELVNLPSRFDARWYLQIANSGYAFDPKAASDVQQNIVFFPALPIAIRALNVPFGGSLLGSVIAGTLISLLAFGVALVYLRAFVSEAGGADRAETTLWLLAFYPFSLFYGAIYTESLFLAAAVGALYHAQRSEYGRSASWGVLGGLARPNGFLLAVPLAVLTLVRRRPRSSGLDRRYGAAVAAAAAPVAGLLAFAVFLWRTTGDPWMWARGHAAWGRSYQGLMALAADRAHMIAAGGFGGYLAALPHDALNAAGALFTLVTVWPVARTLGLEYALWMLLTIIPPLAAGGFISAGRFSSVLFPSFIWLASVVPAKHRPVWIGVFAALQAVCAAMFYTWRPLY